MLLVPLYSKPKILSSIIFRENTRIGDIQKKRVFEAARGNKCAGGRTAINPITVPSPVHHIPFRFSPSSGGLNKQDGQGERKG